MHKWQHTLLLALDCAVQRHARRSVRPVNDSGTLRISIGHARGVALVLVPDARIGRLSRHSKEFR
jgi:hypothetical protein